MTAKRAHPFYSSRAWRALSLRAAKRDGFCCVWCGADVSGKGARRCDHIVPITKAWNLRLVLDNVRTLCARCDNQRHAEKGRGVISVFGCGPDGRPLDPKHWWNQ